MKEATPERRVHAEQSEPGESKRLRRRQRSGRGSVHTRNEAFTSRIYTHGPRTALGLTLAPQFPPALPTSLRPAQGASCR